jgi:hypothetical protein
MPAKRTDHISKRDLEVLDYIARFGVVPRYAVAHWANTRATVTRTRERRLEKEGLIRVERGYGPIGPVALATKLGLKASGRRELRPARLSLAALTHDTIVSELAADLERLGQTVLSEREILARERAVGEPVLSASLPSGRIHRADLVRIEPDGTPREAIEVELSTKGAARLDELMRGWRRAVLDGRVTGVVYRCAPRTLPYVRRAVERTRTEAVVTVEPLRIDGSAGTLAGVASRPFSPAP